MPSEKILSEKKQQVAAISDKLRSAASVVLVDYKGINVENDTKMRAEMRAESVDYSVVKNTLFKLACQETGLTDFIPVLEGTTAVAVSSDEVAPARIIQKYSARYRDRFNFKMGYVGGRFVNPDQLKSIAALPGREGLIGQVAGTLNGIIASLARAISEVAKLKEEPAA